MGIDMKTTYTYIDDNGTFRMEKPEKSSFLYFPLAGESGLKSCVTPLLGGDSKLDQNTFLLQPVSAEELHNLRSSRNFWFLIEGQGAWSAAGVSGETESLKDSELEEDSVLEAGLMWHRVERHSRKYPLSAVITSFVPCDQTAFEIMEVTVRNHGSIPVSVVPVSAIPLYGRSADNLRDHRHVTSLLHRTEVTEFGIEVTPTLTFDERGHKKNRFTYFAYGTDESGNGPKACCPDLEDFIGEGGTLTHPEQVFGRRNAADPDRAVWKEKGSKSAGREAIAAFLFEERTLQPGEESTYCIYLGLMPRDEADGNSPEHNAGIAEGIDSGAGQLKTRDRLIGEYAGKAKAEKALEKVKEYWIKKTNVHYETGDRDLNGFLYWVTFQPILRRMYGCSFLPYHDYGKGGRGWRDLWQDCLALMMMEPERVREILTDSYRGVRFDGTNATIIGEKQGEFLADRNNISRVWMDHGFWPFQTTAFYIGQTGDLDILAEEIPYFKDAQIGRYEQKDVLWTPDQGTFQKDIKGRTVYGSVLEHILLENLTAFYDVGEHNHIRLRGADWNDGLDMAVQRGESVTFTAAYAGNYQTLAEMLRRYALAGRKTMSFHREILLLLNQKEEIFDSVAGKQALLRRFGAQCTHVISGEKTDISLEEIANTLEQMARWIRNHIRDTEWIETEDGSFYNGYYDNHGCRLEGRFPSGTRMTLTSQVFPIMFDTASDWQISRITEAADALLYRSDVGGYRLNTDFHEVKSDMGRAFAFAYGHKENGAAFSHMAVMYANALYKRGFICEGYKALDALYRQAADFEKSRTYPGLPEYFNDRGRGMYPYLTGSASWMMMTVVTEVYGIKGVYGDLCFEPKLLDCQLDEAGAIGISLTFAGVPLHIRYKAGERREIYRQVKQLYLDGELVEGNVIPREKLTEKRERREILGIL